MRLLSLVLALCCITQPLAAQQRKPESQPRQRVPAKPVIKVWQAGALLGLTAGAVVLDQRVHDALGRDTTKLANILVRFGDAEGNPVYVYPVLLVGTLAGRALGSKVLEGVSWRALESTAIAGATALILKSGIGRRRPDISPNDPFRFGPFTFKYNSFPSGHTTVAFALATSLAAETKDHWTDVLFFSGATLTAFARINDNRHWLSDAVFGASLGIVAGRLVHRWHRSFLVCPGVVAASFSF